MMYERLLRSKLMPDIYKDILIIAIISSILGLISCIFFLKVISNDIKQNCMSVPLDQIKGTNCIKVLSSE